MSMSTNFKYMLLVSNCLFALFFVNVDNGIALLNLASVILLAIDLTVNKQDDYE